MYIVRSWAVRWITRSHENIFLIYMYVCMYHDGMRRFVIDVRNYHLQPVNIGSGNGLAPCFNNSWPVPMWTDI